MEKLIGWPSEILWHRWSKTSRKNVNKLIGSQYSFAQISFFTFFLTVLDRRCYKFSEGYPSNFSTEWSSQIFYCCPRNFVIQEERIGNVVSTSHWIRPVYRSAHELSAYLHRLWHMIRRSRPLSMLRALRKRVLILGSSSTGLPSACSSTHDSTVSTSSTPSNRNSTTISVSENYSNFLRQVLLSPVNKVAGL